METFLLIWEKLDFVFLGGIETTLSYFVLCSDSVDASLGHLGSEDSGLLRFILILIFEYSLKKKVRYPENIQLKQSFSSVII